LFAQLSDPPRKSSPQREKEAIKRLGGSMLMNYIEDHILIECLLQEAIGHFL
jgi:hypothetical protein